MSYILLTGATGMLGAAILEKLLQTGHNVNAVLRSFARSKAFLEKRYHNAVQSGHLTFTEIPDMTKPGVFDAVVQGASEFIHAATPLAKGDEYLEAMIKPTSAVIENVLRATAASPKTTRLIITGSIVSTLRMPDDIMSGRTISDNDWNSITIEEAVKGLPPAYTYSKVTSEKEAWAFMEKNKPNFDLIYLLAPVITGKNVQDGFKATKLDLGGFSRFYNGIFDTEKPGSMFPYWMDVEDVATIHVKALDRSVPGNERYLFHTRGVMLGDDAANIVRKRFPELHSRVPAGSAHPEIPENLFKTNIDRAEKIFGIEWKELEESVVDMVNDILKSEKKIRGDLK